MTVKCSLCGKTLKPQDKVQFYPEDDSLVCSQCLSQHRETVAALVERSNRMKS